MMYRKLMAAAMLAAPFTLNAVPADFSSHTVLESWFTTRQHDENVDSPAVWHGPEGQDWLIVTAKASHCLNVFDARNGYFLKRVGGLGSEAGQFSRPNGISVIDDLVFVVERDNRRVQVMSLPDFQPLGCFGQDDLGKPYGIAVTKTGEGEYKLYVTDDYETPEGEQPPPEQLGHRVRLYDVEVAGPDAEGELVATFGDTTGKGVLYTVESIIADPEYNRLMVADEDEDTPGAHNIKVYDLAGKFTGQTLGDGLFHFQAEGIAVLETGEGEGVWIFTDQGKTANYFHCFDRRSLEYLGSVNGTYTLNTDGIWVDGSSSERFPNGVLFAIDNDTSVAAIDMAAILKAIGRE